MITIRKSNWNQRLDNYIQKVELRKFKYGQHDCIQFAAGAFKAMTGLDAMEGIPKYTKAIQAFALLEDYGGVFNATHTALMKHPVEVKPTKYAITGDIVGFRNHDDQETVGVVYDMGSIAVVGSKGLEFIPVFPNAVKCWSV